MKQYHEILKKKTNKDTKSAFTKKYTNRSK